MEKDNKKIKASSWILALLLIVSAVVLGMFYGVGYGLQDSFNGNVYTAPQNTGMLIVWMYAMVGICIGSVLLFGLVSMINGIRYRKLRGARVSYFGIIFLLTVAIVAVSYFMASPDPVRLGDKTLFENVAMLKLTDVCVYSIYALVIVTILSTFLSMIGVFKARR